MYNHASKLRKAYPPTVHHCHNPRWQGTHPHGCSPRDNLVIRHFCKTPTGEGIVQTDLKFVATVTTGGRVKIFPAV